MRKWLISIMAVVALCFFGCAEGDGDDPAESNGTAGGDCVDRDGDGFDGRSSSCPDGQDCDDFDMASNPNGTEVCGDRKDNDCDGSIDNDCNGDCTDNDGDNFGVGSGCLGPDCDDNNADINPRATDDCMTAADEDCDGTPRVCPTNCIDEDGDGFGAPGSTDCEGEGDDCDDTDPTINPGALEVCDDADNNCADGVDECPGSGQGCVDGACIGGAGSECENNDDCAGDKLGCDTSVDPKVCKGREDAPCGDVSECFDGLACENNVCTGNFCANNQCNGQYDVCDRDGAKCVECPHFDPDPAVQDAACNAPEQCVPGGWCVQNWDTVISSMAARADSTEDLFQVNLALVKCWMAKEGGDKDMCYTFFIGNSISRPITKDLVKDAFTEGDLDTEWNSSEYDELIEIWGVGFLNLEDINWKADLVPGTAKEVCLWYEPGGFFSEETMVLDLCTNFTP